MSSEFFALELENIEKHVEQDWSFVETSWDNLIKDLELLYNLALEEKEIYCKEEKKDKLVQENKEDKEYKSERKISKSNSLVETKNISQEFNFEELADIISSKELSSNNNPYHKPGLLRNKTLMEKGESTTKVISSDKIDLYKGNLNSLILDILSFERESVKLKPIKKKDDTLKIINKLVETDLDEIKANLDKCIIDGIFNIQTFYQIFSNLKRATE